MRIFVKLDLNNIVISQVESDRIPGDGVNLPANIIEVTDRIFPNMRGCIIRSTRRDKMNSDVCRRSAIIAHDQMQLLAGFIRAHRVNRS